MLAKFVDGPMAGQQLAIASDEPYFVVHGNPVLPDIDSLAKYPTRPITFDEVIYNKVGKTIYGQILYATHIVPCSYCGEVH